MYYSKHHIMVNHK